MDLHRVILKFILLLIVDAKIIKKDDEIKQLIQNDSKNTITIKKYNNNGEAFNGVYSECFIKFSFPCVQIKTLNYLRELNNLNELSLFGEYVKFVRVNTSNSEDNTDEMNLESDSEDLTRLIDQAIDKFFDNHALKFNALGRDISIPNNIEEFVGRKKRKGGGGGGMMEGHDGGHFGHKKMMMMAMMCMKMKLMMMIPAMMGMMGMMSFKGMMFSMMSFMASKMMLLMRILEKKGGLGGANGGVGGGDGGWSAGGGSGGAWMPAGGQDFGSGGGYDANGQWQSRSIFEGKELFDNKPVISYIAPIVTYNNPTMLKKIKRNDIVNVTKNQTIKSRRKRSIMDVLQNSYMYWMNKLLGLNNKNRRTSNIPKYKIVNGIKYVYNPYAYRQQKLKMPKEIQVNKIKNNIDQTPILTAADFNKGEIVDGAVESRTIRKKFHKMKDTVNDTLDENPWE